MKDKDIDYKNLDKLDIYAKKEKVDMVVDGYQSFGWELIENKENHKYEDTCELTFVRPHNIANKDELQYRQIEMENIMNSMGKIERNKVARTTTSYLCLGILSAIFIVMGIFTLLNSLSPLNIILAIASFVAGILCTLLTIFLTIKIYKREREHYKSSHKELEDSLAKLKEDIIKSRSKNDAKEN